MVTKLKLHLAYVSFKCGAVYTYWETLTNIAYCKYGMSAYNILSAVLDSVYYSNIYYSSEF